MKTKMLALVAITLGGLSIDSMCAQGTAFIYQGRLCDAGQPANGSYDLQFALYNVSSGGTQTGLSLTNMATAVRNGSFVVALDFGSGVFSGRNYWLDILVRTNGSGEFTALSPRQQIAAAPYAIFANATSNLSGGLSVTQLNGTIPVAQLPGILVTNGQTGLTLGGSFNGDAAGLTNLRAASLVGTMTNNTTGSASTLSGQQLGTVAFFTNNSPFDASWTGITGYALTNNPYLQICEAYPTGDLAFGYVPSITGVAPSGGTKRIRFKMVVDGSACGFDMPIGGQLFFSTDASQWALYSLPYTGDHLYVTVSFPAAGNHTVEFEIANDLVGIYCPRTNAFVECATPLRRAVLVGDSFTDGANGVGGHTTCGGQLDDLLLPSGIDIISSGVGGTGYTATSGSHTNFQGRILRDVISHNPDIVIVAGGINDPSTPSNTLYTAATALYQTIQNSLPLAALMVVGPFSSDGNGSSTANSQTLSNACASMGIPIIFPAYSSESSWITGSYNSPGSGNATEYISSDGTHPTVAGHAFLARQLQDFIQVNAGAGTLALSSITLSTNAATPVNSSVPAVWFNISSGGRVFKVPGYQ